MDQATSQKTNNHNPTRILVVDDDGFLRQIYFDTLTDAGYMVAVAENGVEGLKRISEGGWDLVLLDIMMPQMSGVEVIKKIRDFAPTDPPPKVVFLTNLDDGPEFREAKTLTPYYLIKSDLTPGDLLDKIKEFLTP